LKAIWGDYKWSSLNLLKPHPFEEFSAVALSENTLLALDWREENEKFHNCINSTIFLKSFYVFYEEEL